jgi:hypothetical protein
MKKKMDTQESRDFWASFPVPDDNDEPMPSIGCNWWDQESSLSPCLLSEAR